MICGSDLSLEGQKVDRNMNNKNQVMRCKLQMSALLGGKLTRNHTRYTLTKMSAFYPCSKALYELSLKVAA